MVNTVRDETSRIPLAVAANFDPLVLTGVDSARRLVVQRE